MMRTVYSGECEMVQVRWWRPLTPPLAARRPERAWVRPTRATGNVQRQVTGLRPTCLHVQVVACTRFLLKIDIRLCAVMSSSLSVPAAHVLTWEWIRKPDGRISCQDEGWVTFFTHMTFYFLLCICPVLIFLCICIFQASLASHGCVLVTSMR